MTEINTRNNQELVNKFFNVFFVDKTPRCVSEAGDCQYAPQKEGQVGCAVGMFLSLDDAVSLDEYFKASGQGSGIRSVRLSQPNMYDKYFDHEQIDFLKQLQSCHDRLDDSWFNDQSDLNTIRLNTICKEYNLINPQTGEDHAYQD